jgi:feruloyl esterase
MSAARTLILAAAAALAGLSAAPAWAADCSAIERIVPTDVHIDKVTAHDADAPLTPPFPGAKPIARSLCRVEGRIEKEIGFELWLPAKADWNGRILVGGVGGQAGSFNYRELARGAARGYASASTDTGHKASDPHWLLGDRMRAENYAGRANHLLAQRVKAIVASWYGRAAAHAFFVGCSGGGRQALTEVQRYPEDFDGVIAGAPGVNTPEMSARRIWEMQRHSAFGALMTDAQWMLVADAGVAACDGLDGVRDGVIDDPRLCRFDPASLACQGPVNAGCLAPEQIAAARQIYAPLRDERGRRIDDGLLPGVKVQRAILPEPFTPGPPYLAVALFGDGVHRDPNWDARSFRIDRDLQAIDRVMDLHADNPDIRAFARRGGKLIVYHGWADPLVSPLPTIKWFEAARRVLGARADNHLRLLMAPGVEHCVGGKGPDLFGGAGGDAPIADASHDLLSALERWVDNGAAPDQIVATKRRGSEPQRTRPLCAWPAAARYNGAGSSDDARNFTCSLEAGS